jgi:hypothetical protein
MIFQRTSKGVFTLKITRPAQEANMSTPGIFTKTLIETKELLNSFLSVNRNKRWYNLHYSSLNQVYYAYDTDILPSENLPYTGYYHINDPEHHNYVACVVEETPAPYEEFVAGGLYHVATFEGPQSQLSSTHQILPYIKHTAAQGEEIPVDIPPVASTSQVKIQPEMGAPAYINTQCFRQQGAPAQAQG